ncbi:hypothetical protein [Salinimicrobium sp. GXAS 041]|uniref:hypothetical protein n=1 Tax=Salinimicrobium sp. GXAS 041 TaxID=3400806 RepID=UPI003C71406D
MKTFKSHPAFLLLLLSLSWNLHSQNIDNKLVVKQIYDVLQEKNVSFTAIKILTPAINWNDAEPGTDNFDKYKITLHSTMQNKWQHLQFKDLKFEEPVENEVVVTGIIMGRQLTECEYILTRFKHSWYLKKGEITGFSE